MRFFTTVHILLLAYIVTALIFWEFSLQKQSGRIYTQEVITLRSKIDSNKYPQEYHEQLTQLTKALHGRTIQYVGEGSTFLIVIIIGAIIVYSSFRRRILLSRQQNNFMLSVTHELKSPIAAIKLNLQTIEKHRLDDRQRSQLVDRSVKEANRLNDLCNNILFASQMDARKYKAAHESFNFSGMVEDAVDEYATRYPQRFEEEIESGCYLLGDKVMLQMMVNNLLENAIKYTPAASPITITLRKDGRIGVLSIRDHGAGIPDDEKKKIFTKFYRVGNEETRKTKGTGLGLYLVNKVVQQHKGQISIKDNEPSGAVFEIQLWLKDA